MTVLTNPVDSSTLAALTRSAPRQVVSAVRQASRQTGVDFSYLLQQAKAESSFQTDAKAKTSSATGLYQFIDSTWLQMVRDHGHKYGLAGQAAKIDSKGQVADPQERQKILDMRYDPEISSALAAEFASGNKRFLERHWGGEIGSTELYFAHFMGAGGAAAFLKAKDETPLQYGADIFPREAAANRNVFYDPASGKPRTLAGIYEFFDRKFSIEDKASGSHSMADLMPQTDTAEELLTSAANPDIPWNTGARSARPVQANFSAFAGSEFLLSPQDLLLLSVLRENNA